MRAPRSFVLFALAAIAVACRSVATPVAVQGAPAALAALRGEWAGEYRNDDSHRAGSIVFRLEGGDSATASGDVVMMDPNGVAVRAAHDPSEHRLHARGAEVLRIAFVRADGARVTGEMEPYIAPNCACVVRTTFTGTVEGRRVQGTFVTTGSGIRETGWWEVRRR